MNFRIIDTVAITKGEFHVVALGDKTYVHYQGERGYAVFEEAGRELTEDINTRLIAAIVGGVEREVKGGDRDADNDADN